MINERFGYDGDRPGAPYGNKSEKKKYKSALQEFNEGLENVEKKLVTTLKSGKGYKDLDQHSKSIVDNLSSPYSAILPDDPRILSLQIGVSPFRLAVHPELDNFQIEVMERPKKITTSSGSVDGKAEAISVSLRQVNPVANALGLIAKYKGSLGKVPKENKDVEQPAYMVHFLEKAVEDISPKMMKYMKERISKCVNEPESNIRNPEAVSLEKGKQREL